MSSPEEKKKRKRMTTTKKKKKPPPPLVLTPTPPLVLTPTPPLVLTPTPQSTPNPYLPDDLLLSCFARVSRLYYPTLSLVSKTFPSLLASPELYKTRSFIGHTDSCLYVCLRFHPDSIRRWYTLCRKPDKTLTTKKLKKKSSGYALAKIPTPHSGPARWSGLVTLGSDIYNIGGPINNVSGEHSSSVLIFDSRSNTWREGPSMLVKRWHPVAYVLDGKIYVCGGCKYGSSSSEWMEVFDPKKQTWELVPGPGAEICGSIIDKSAGFDGKVYAFGNDNGLAYKPKEGRWERVGEEMKRDWPWHSYVVIDDVLCKYTEGGFKWYDPKLGGWRLFMGVKGLPKFPNNSPKLADYGGKMAVLWERVLASTGYKDKMILCAVIALERRNDEEMWGKVEWHDTVLTVPKSFELDFARATTV